jgi:hypothetical protein
MKGGDGQPKGYWRVDCVYCQFTREHLTLVEMRSIRAQHQDETGHKCGTHRMRPLRPGEKP